MRPGHESRVTPITLDQEESGTTLRVVPHFSWNPLVSAPSPATTPSPTPLAAAPSSRSTLLPTSRLHPRTLRSLLRLPRLSASSSCRASVLKIKSWPWLGLPSGGGSEEIRWRGSSSGGAEARSGRATAEMVDAEAMAVVRDGCTWRGGSSAPSTWRNSALPCTTRCCPVDGEAGSQLHHPLLPEDQSCPKQCPSLAPSPPSTTHVAGKSASQAKALPSTEHIHVKLLWSNKDQRTHGAIKMYELDHLDCFRFWKPSCFIGRGFIPHWTRGEQGAAGRGGLELA
ncbi:hypothetical protein BRADI_1g35454v3 [Brachypodium distachyon]|uniref:Uncharacterized protein n=1 Tax=Brachypodium distachyon TaxID=15368 RepID=A0A0Q3JIS0_BRADI|nr:hypothetical protein BRADI_1g35454v3 [Brachypodium distachyon]